MFLLGCRILDTICDVPLERKTRLDSGGTNGGWARWGGVDATDGTAFQSPLLRHHADRGDGPPEAMRHAFLIPLGLNASDEPQTGVG